MPVSGLLPLVRGEGEAVSRPSRPVAAAEESRCSRRPLPGLGGGCWGLVFAVLSCRAGPARSGAERAVPCQGAPGESPPARDLALGWQLIKVTFVSGLIGFLPFLSRVRVGSG